MKIRSNDISYLGNTSWQELTREERFFTAVLFFELCHELQPFLDLLLQKDILKRPFDGALFEPAFEVCFYRDLFHKYQMNKGKDFFSLKRTFDLALFSEELLIIVEAKANQSFHNSQLISINEEKESIKHFLSGLNDYKCPEILIIALISSNYQPKDSTKNTFDKHLITWNEIAGVYSNSCEIFHHANDCYKR